ncbi:MAG: MFS transporter [Dysgonomonas sp.]
MSKAKVETAEQKAKRQAKEQKELAKWEREKAKPKSKLYFWYLFFVVALIFVVDEVASTIGTHMQAEIAIGLFNDKLSIMSLVGAFSLPMMALATFYKSLADRYGRKLFLCINTLGMGAGLFFVFLAGSIGAMPGMLMYVGAMMVVNFFIPNDMQVVYLMENAPQNRRATMLSVLKGIGTLGSVLIPLMRSTFMGSDVTKWYLVYLIPSLIGLFAATFALVTARESDVFLNNRINFLKMTDGERAAEAATRSKGSQAQGGIGHAFRFAFGHKQLRWLFIAIVIFRIGGMGSAYYPQISNVFYETADVTTILFVYSFASAFITLLNGFVSDKIGRKKTIMLFAFTAFTSFVLFYAGSYLRWSPILIGCFIGFYVGSFFSATDNLGSIMIGESSPTNLRASIMSSATVMSMIGGMLAIIIPTITLFASSDNYATLGMVCMVVSAPVMAIALVIIITKVGDTKHVELDTVRGDEWD